MFTAHPSIADADLTEPQFIADDDRIPAIYRAICRTMNGGFLAQFSLPTSEPTNDGLADVECHYLAGIAQHGEVTIQAPALPDYLIPFSQHHQRYFAFDYHQSSDEPQIRYIDTEVDQWLVVADSLTSFLTQLSPKIIDLNIENKLTPLQRNHYLLVAQGAQLDALLARYEADADKQWLFDWLLYFAEQGTPAQQMSALIAYDIQRLYFKRQLPRIKSAQLTTIFEQLPSLKDAYHAYQKTWSPL
ncbi:SMI1/KNR4 family protein [Latilactobacillus graminis]|uniref:Knr4/Smi1-like domain-containing protein n=2 Tax=Latilactobacillus graminis TaxID=60519 RepID=A0AA89KYL4_9LACO|nr:SMI1/KNR4 family protein [Latilactobacillus graminis]KRM24484.1 hypothetical protein FC90_GL000189 [Latilactobacillus graminis DSM 20719]QFP79058.1 SMI1/KNR4 family protein [Latilactobacillus graminis]